MTSIRNIPTLQLLVVETLQSKPRNIINLKRSVARKSPGVTIDDIWMVLNALIQKTFVSLKNDEFHLYPVAFSPNRVYAMTGTRDDFPYPCRDSIDFLSKVDISLLVAWIFSGLLTKADLSYAGEILGTAGTSDQVLLPLLHLLSNKSPLVREGAVLGLSHHLSPGVATKLRQLSGNDPSPGVRAAAFDILDEVEHSSPVCDYCEGSKWMESYDHMRNEPCSSCQ